MRYFRVPQKYLFFGGPVQQERGFVLHTTVGLDADGIKSISLTTS
jgi:putative AlgH/UPF0301 family transcriptional regulator